MWDVASQSLIWVDITGRHVHRHWPATQRTETFLVPLPVGAACLDTAGGFVLALEDGYWATDAASGNVIPIARVHPPESGLRMNDGKCDPRGRFLAGTMAYDLRPGAGTLYSLDPDRTLRTLIGGVGISNGLDWSPDGRTMYYIDSLTQSVVSYDYDLTTGAVANPRTRIVIDPADGLPDGMTVDASGRIYVALWNGWAIRRYLQSGALDEVYRLPVAQVTSCAFGGAGLDELFVTTASMLSAEDNVAQPLAGSVFVIRPGGVGRPSTRFGAGAT